MWLWCQNEQHEITICFFENTTHFFDNSTLITGFIPCLGTNPYLAKKPLTMEGLVWHPAMYKTSNNPGGDRNPSPRTSEPKPSKSDLTTQVATWVSAGHHIVVLIKGKPTKTYRRSQVLKVYVFLFRCFCIVFYFAWSKKNIIWYISIFTRVIPQVLPSVRLDVLFLLCFRSVKGNVSHI